MANRNANLMKLRGIPQLWYELRFPCGKASARHAWKEEVLSHEEFLSLPRSLLRKELIGLAFNLSLDTHLGVEVGKLATGGVFVTQQSKLMESCHRWNARNVVGDGTFKASLCYHPGTRMECNKSMSHLCRNR